MSFQHFLSRRFFISMPTIADATPELSAVIFDASHTLGKDIAVIFTPQPATDRRRRDTRSTDYMLLRFLPSFLLTAISFRARGRIAGQPRLSPL